jgi:hypothetical protein
MQGVRLPLPTYPTQWRVLRARWPASSAPHRRVRQYLTGEPFTRNGEAKISAAYLLHTGMQPFIIF